MIQVISREESNRAIEEIVKRAQTDSAFRQLCLTNPNAAVKQATGKDLPNNFTLRFVENQGADLTIVLPDLIDVNNELSDEELDQVAGGGKTVCAASCAVTSCACFPLPTVTGIGSI